MSKSTKELENEIHELRVERSKQWQLGKENRDDSVIEKCNDKMNKLKSIVKERYG